MQLCASSCITQKMYFLCNTIQKTPQQQHGTWIFGQRLHCQRVLNVIIFSYIIKFGNIGCIFTVTCLIRETGSFLDPRKVYPSSIQIVQSIFDRYRAFRRCQMNWSSFDRARPRYLYKQYKYIFQSSIQVLANPKGK